MTNEQQPNQPLTRRQLRELRSTGATPILTPEGTPIMPPAQATTAANEAKAPSDADDRQDVGQACRLQHHAHSGARRGTSRIETEQIGRTGIRQQPPREDADRGSLSGSVRAEQRVHLAWSDTQG